MSDAVRPVQTIEQVTALAMQLGSRHLADYGANTSRHDFTQRQLMACLVLRAYTKTTYRGILELLTVRPSLRKELGLTDKLPHYSTLAKFSERSQVLEIADAMIRTIGRASFGQSPEPTAAAMDATGLETTTASAHFQCRRGGQRRKWIKLSTIVICGSLLPMSLVVDWGADQRQMPGQGTNGQGADGVDARHPLRRRGLRCRMGPRSMPGRMGTGKRD
jgi:hypothetical protein